MTALSLTEKDLENLKNYKYATGGKTKLDVIMNPYWEYCSKLLPYRLTPNMVTLAGFMCQLLCVIIIGCYDLTLKKELPTYMYFFFSFLFFLAQTFDAIDGKHARNTKRSSPLGQLMDHGCDAMGNFIYALCISQAYQFGNSFKTLLIEIGIQNEFIIFTVEESFTKCLRTNIQGIGVTEFQFLAMGLIILSIFFRDIVNTVTIYGILLIDWAIIIVGICSVIQVFGLVYGTYTNFKELIHRWYFIGVFFFFAVAEVLGYFSYAFQTTPYLVYVLNGTYYGLITSKIIVYNVAHKKLPYYDIDAIIYLIGMVLINIIKGEKEGKIILIVLTIWIAFRLYYVIFRTIKFLLKYLNISF